MERLHQKHWKKQKNLTRKIQEFTCWKELTNTIHRNNMAVAKKKVKNFSRKRVPFRLGRSHSSQTKLVLQPAACPNPSWERVTVEGAISDVRRAAAAAGRALHGDDPATALVMIGAARAGLGDIAERYGDPTLISERRQVVEAARQLAVIAAAIRQGDAAAAGQLADWTAGMPVWGRTLARTQPRSLYEPSRLAAETRPPISGGSAARP